MYHQSLDPLPSPRDVFHPLSLTPSRISLDPPQLVRRTKPRYWEVRFDSFHLNGQMIRRLKSENQFVQLLFLWK